MLVALTILIMLAMAAFDVPSLVRLKEWGEIKVYAFVWLVGLTLGLLQVMGVPLPNPTEWIIKTMPPVVTAIGKLLGLA